MPEAMALAAEHAGQSSNVQGAELLLSTIACIVERSASSSRQGAPRSPPADAEEVEDESHT
eukprot:615133-Amphidinium_carterae.1